MTEERDVVIVGGGPAGTTAAIALAGIAPALAARTVIVEKGVYPREKYCAGALGARGEKILAKFSAVPDVPSVVIDGISLRANGGETSAGASAIGRVVRRIEFDHALAKIAAARGVEVRDGTRVDSVTVAEGGAFVQTSRGAIRARIVVGADGVGSVVRRAMGLSAGALRAQVLEVDTQPVAGDRDRRILHFDAEDRRLAGYAWDFPTLVAGEALVCRGMYKLKVDSDARDGAHNATLEGLFAERLERMGLTLKDYRIKRYAERGFDPGERVAVGPMMLVGEAAGIDPVTGEGIAQAIEFGAMAGEFLARRLNDANFEGPAFGWDAIVRASRLGRDLRIRRRFVRLFYGEMRPEIEHFLLESPDTLYVGSQHFADEPYDWMRLGHVLARGAARLTAHHVSRILRSPSGEREALR